MAASPVAKAAIAGRCRARIARPPFTSPTSCSPGPLRCAWRVGRALVWLRGLGQAAPVRGRSARRLGAGYGLIAKLRVVQPELAALPPGAASIELPQTWPVMPVAGAAG